MRFKRSRIGLTSPVPSSAASSPTSPNMDFTLKHVEIDGVSVPANQAADGVRSAIDGADIITGVIHGALAQPIGAALEGSKSACDAVKKRCIQFVRKVDKSAANIQDG